MSKKLNSRRNFLKQMGLGVAAVGALAVPKVVAQTANGYMVESKEEYGGFQVEKLTGGKFPYQVRPEILKSMQERMNVFSRDGWDPVRFEERKKVMEAQGGKDIFTINMIDKKGLSPNQTRLDYAFMQAAWSSARFRNSPYYGWDIHSGAIKQLSDFGKWNPADNGMNWEEASIAIKHASNFYGASLAGIAAVNPLWIYDEYAPKDEPEEVVEEVKEGEEPHPRRKKRIPKEMKHVIALAFEEDYYGIMNSPGRLASAATGDGYSRMAITSFAVAEFIRALGYNAIPSGNDTALSVPIAIDAGLGELGRNGLLITPKYGPRVRLAKVFTDMPLVPDTPISFGVTEFCDVCMLCAEDCPSGSISKAERTWEGKSVSNNPGVFKWYVSPESCNDYNGFSCSNCKRNCPFNKPNNSWLHKLIRENIKLRIKPLDQIMVQFDQASGYGEQLQDSEYWKLGGETNRNARDGEV